MWWKTLEFPLFSSLRFPALGLIQRDLFTLTLRNVPSVSETRWDVLFVALYDVFVLGKAITWENWFPGQKSSYLGTVQSLQFPLNLGKKDQLINKGWKAAKWEGCVKRAVIWIWCVKGCVLFILKRKPKSWRFFFLVFFLVVWSTNSLFVWLRSHISGQRRNNVWFW